jgi:hypothetical protein
MSCGVRCYVIAKEKVYVLIIRYVFKQWCQNVRCLFMVSRKNGSVIVVALIKHTHTASSCTCIPWINMAV